MHVNQPLLLPVESLYRREKWVKVILCLPAACPDDTFLEWVGISRTWKHQSQSFAE